ncbi:Unconventional prefoldin RPB5 interactor-like protein [Lucilia cuprina]|nr:Unconventional prefoldin RPB5 interactor-like protein [Lucilia cuprina]
MLLERTPLIHKLSKQKALQKNEEEAQRWQNYLKENETAIENMAIWQKAFMPGHLLHTNEVLVGHYQGYFSNAPPLRQKRFEHLKKLQTEADLWQKTLCEGVMPSGEEREIIEDFNEEEEKLWKEKHRIRVNRLNKRSAKKEKRVTKEKLKNKKVTEEKSDEEIFKIIIIDEYNNNVQPNPEITNLVDSQEEDDTELDEDTFTRGSNWMKRYVCLNVLENLEELLEMAEETVDKKENEEKQLSDNKEQIVSTSTKVRQIKLFKNDQTLEFRKHEAVTQMLPPKTENPNILQSSMDFYDLHKKSLETETEPSTWFINSYEGEDQVRTPVLKEADRQAAFADPKAEFSIPSLQAKPILKNKSAVDKENHLKDTQQQNNINKNKKSKKKSNKKEEDDCFSAITKVMNDVIEKPLTEPEPLPDVKFIDAHTPKKRISRFKQMRQGTDKT